MINRSLIRIKTIQILYSYLLTRTDFKLEPAPRDGETNRDRLFAYSVYIDFLFLLQKLSSIPLGAASGAKIVPDAVLKKNRVGQALRSDPAMQTIINRYRDSLSKFDSCLPELVTAITETAAYNDFKRKRKLEMADDVAFWTTIFSTTIRKSKTVERILRQSDSFSHVGLEQGLKMFVATLGSFDETRATYLNARNALDRSLALAYSLYHALLELPVHITDLQLRRIDDAKHKYLPTPEDLNPNMRLADNLFVEALRKCEPLQKYITDNPEADSSSWRDSDLLFNTLLDRILASDLYKEYIETPAGDFATDANFWREVLRTIILPSDELSDILETRSVYWNDDLQIMGTFVLKTIRRSFASPDDNEKALPAGTIELLPKFMNKDDERFGTQLFEYVVTNRETYRSYIDRFIDNKQWDSERLAFMDIVLMLTAIAEIINFPTIPIPVTMNEYIEIANDYSTPRSGQFINGILFSVVKMLQTDGIIDKK